ncbi:LptF/LptG family permease [Candidatus Pelagibacter sp. Uisw_127]|uniref:LptF/LptG family permease n=1 Tax=Candidatus Pelagibacter sp. Uisw_127 TaxID=3230988 RepID=UPI0039EA8C77
MKKIILNKIGLDCFKFFLLSTFTISLIIWVLQAVNYLDIVIEDGHGFIVYLKYTLLSFPKIFDKILPFTLFFSFTYTLLSYEKKNELVIFWNFGVHKKTFIHYFIKISLLFIILNLLLSSIVVPTALDKGRSFIRTSDLDFFESVLKPKKFIDVIKNLTIYFDKKTPDGVLVNIFLKDDKENNDFQITYAKNGELQTRNGKKILVLYDGKTITKKNESISQFKFSKTDFNFSQIETKTISTIKTQENSTKHLIACAVLLNKVKNKKKTHNAVNNISNCRLGNLENIYKEIYGRIITPLYCTILVMISLFLIIKSKHESTFRFYKFKIYAYGFLLILFLEISLKFIGANLLHNLFFIILPFALSALLYFLLINKLNFKI